MASPEAPTADKFQILPEESKKSKDADSMLLVVFVILANFIAFISLGLAIVGVAQNGSNVYNIGTSSGSDNGFSSGTWSGGFSSGTWSGGFSSGTWSGGFSSGEKIWIFQIGHYVGNTQYLDESSGTIKGYNVDVVNAVCQLANKNCALVWDLYENCWDSQVGQRARGGKGLMGSWYHACVGWANTRDRARTYLFSSSFEKSLSPAYFVKKGGSFDFFPNFSGKKVGILDGWSVDEHCLARYNDVTGFDETDVMQVTHYGSEDDIIAALSSDTIDVAFVPRTPYFDMSQMVEYTGEPGEDLCVIGGPAMMMRKDQFELRTWWDAFFEKLIATSQYNDICDNVEETHGDQPGFDKEYVCVV
ncbi:hypothetical protein HOLleu_27460 [Holothuria leucospilota]|uniref:Solute-binding protein family 3/N-terminal domain-containing protein n=1 Tax=Holothuria leucospilota TaxID=206669 RepID=A0A9Q1H2S3_HOLLE|nr:hypothetical protein HOLleu_27460 [Holothuria leucospilota]